MSTVTSRHTPTPRDGCFQIGRWTVDPAAGELRDGDARVRLRPKALSLLVALARRPGQVLGKETILDAVWPDVVVGDASVSVLVAELRGALDDDPASPRFIETIPRRGYRLIAPVSRPDIATPQPHDDVPRIWLLGKHLEAVLEPGETLIGRAPGAHVRIQSPKVSRHHARVVVDGDNVTVEDLGSKNGTFVNGRNVDGRTALAHGDELRLGQLSSALRVVVVGDGSTVTELSREKPSTHSDPYED
jgi:DNA-binding winged helix-turn-helix (wHTH) protein